MILSIVAESASTDSGSGDKIAVVSLVVAVAAAVIAIWIAIYQVRATERFAKLQTYQRLHEALVSETPSRGRRMLFLAHGNQSYPGPKDDSWDEINQALALYDTLGAYVCLGQVPEDVVMRAWFHPLKEIQPAVAGFVAHRSELGIKQPWAYLTDLLNKVQQFTCKCPSCASNARP